MLDPKNAFPFTAVAEDGTPVCYPGMTLRDYFAAAVLPALITVNPSDTETSMADVLEIAYIYADAMIEERDRAHQE